MSDNSHLYSCSIDNRPLIGGFFGCKFDADGLPVGYPVLQPDDSGRDARIARVLGAERSDSLNRLVKVSKCPTPLFSGERSDIFDSEAEPSPFIEMLDGRIDLNTGEVIKDYKRENHVKVIFEQKPWADEYRVRTKLDMPVDKLPPEQSGERVTKTLSLAGASKLNESCRYVHKERGGYTTFLTLTLDDAARERVENGETVQKQISRFWDAAAKMYKRGWVQEFEGVEHRGEPQSGPLDYCWVVENPKNEAGEDNPHVHILMRWRVPYRDFKAWAARIERIWGQGFAHLEKIKEPEKSGAYIAKAAGYMTKGSDGDQGEVRGNRYGISSEARAPGWEFVGSYDAGIMGSLIADVHDFFMNEYGSKIANREYWKKKLDETPKEDKQQRKAIGQKLQEVREELNDSEKLPVRPSKYQLIMTGVNAFRSFINWAKEPESKTFAPWLPLKPKGVIWSEKEKPEGVYLREFKRRLWCRQLDRAKGMCSQFWKAVNRGVVPDWALVGKDARAEGFVIAGGSDEPEWFADSMNEDGLILA